MTHDERVYHHLYVESKSPMENAERIASLEELVCEVYMLNWNGLDCTECPWFDECKSDGGCPWLGILHDHMRELGVEVTE